MGENPIGEGKISATTSPLCGPHDGRPEMKMQYKGTVAGDEIKMSMQFREACLPRDVYKRVKE